MRNFVINLFYDGQSIILWWLGCLHNAEIIYISNIHFAKLFNSYEDWLNYTIYLKIVGGQIIVKFD
jgi:hypothetical protein